MYISMYILYVIDYYHLCIHIPGDTERPQRLCWVSLCSPGVQEAQRPVKRHCEQTWRRKCKDPSGKLKDTLSLLYVVALTAKRSKKSVWKDQETSAGQANTRRRNVKAM